MTAEKLGMDKPPYRVVELFSGVGSQRMAVVDVLVNLYLSFLAPNGSEQTTLDRW